MSDRTVTALVLLAGTTSSPVRRATVRAVLDQSRAPDRVLLVVPDGIDPAAEVEALDASGLDTDALVRTASSHSRSGALREALRDVVGITADGTVARPQEREVPTSSRSGRRARAIDPDSQERQLAQEAEVVALTPMRLREERRGRGGRRMDMAALNADEDWLWIVPDDAVPGAQALEHQLDTLAQSPRTAVVGAKRLVLDDLADSDAADASADAAAALVDVGISLTHGGRITTGIEPGEIDQGQADWRQDVLAVALPGMLVRVSALRDLGGLDPDLPSPYAEIDLCQRVWRSGERVAVNPAARVLSPLEDATPTQLLRAQRRGQILGQLKLRSPLQAGLLLAWLPLLTLWRVITALLLPAPARALAEARAWWDAMGRARRVMHRGREARACARVPQGRLAPLYLPRGEDLRQRIETIWTNLFADDEASRRERLTGWGVAGTRHGIDDHGYGRHLVWASVLAVSAVGLTLFVLRRLVAQGELVGPSLVALPQHWQDTLAVAWTSWVPSGLGWRGPADPLLRLLGALPLPGELVMGSVVFGALPVAALAAWWAAGTLTRAVGARLAIAVLWALAPPAVAALITGAWPILLAHALLPLVALALAHAVGLPQKVHRASVPAAAAGGLVLLIVGAVQPALVALVAAAVLLIMPVVPGRRLRLLWLLVPSAALHAPFLPQYIGRPQLLLGVSALADPGSTPGAGDLVAAWPIPVPVREALASVVGADAAQILLMAPWALIALAAVLALWLRGAAGSVARLGVLVAALAVVAVAVSRQAMMAVVGERIVPAAPHLLLSMVLLALSAAALCLFDACAVRGEGISRLRRVVTVVVAASTAVVAAATVVTWTVLLPGQLDLHRGTRSEVPAAAADLGRSQARGRVLVLRADGEGGARARVLSQGADTAATRSAIVDLRGAQRREQLDQDPASSTLREVSAQLLSRGDAPSPVSLRTLAIGYVVVPGAPEEHNEIIDALDASPVLEKVTQTRTSGLWRVSDAAPRVWIADGQAVEPVPSGPVRAQGSVSAVATDRTLVVSERRDSAWSAQIDGTALEPTTVDGWAQGFVIPAGAEGTLVLERAGDGSWTWPLVLGLTVIVTVLVALPWRRRARGEG